MAARVASANASRHVAKGLTGQPSKDVDGKLPGHVVVKVVGRPAGSYPVTSLDLPLAVTFEFGSSAECATTSLADADASCIAVPGSIRCKSP